MHKNQGITLMSLIITMIVLLMLVGVTLDMAIGNNSIIEKTEKTISENDKKNAKEDTELVISELAKEYYLKDTNGNLLDYLSQRLASSENYKSLSNAIISCDEAGNITYIKNNTTYKFKVNQNGTVTSE